MPRRSMRALLLLPLLALGACTCKAAGLKGIEEAEPDAGKQLVPCVPATEVCNGVDDDCDSRIDEDFTPVDCGVGACARTVAACASGVLQVCTEGRPVAESCNGVDDDCDGTTDEDLLLSMCGVGECANVSPSCTAGQPVVCQPLPSAAEACNGKDDDCDGTVDEGLLSNTSGDLRVTVDAASSDFVYAAWNGSQFGIVWQDRRDGAAQSGEIYFAALSAQGVRLKATDTRLTTTTGTSTHPALAWNGSRYAVVYADNTTGNLELYLAPRAADGASLGAPRQLTSAAGNSDWPDVVWAGGSFAIAWEDTRGATNADLYFARFDPQGTRIGGEVQVTSSGQRETSPILKSNGTEFGLVWSDTRHGAGREIYFRRLSATGQPIGSEVRITNDPADSAWADLTWNSTAREWALVWHDLRDGNSEVYLQRLDLGGGFVGAAVRLTSSLGTSAYPSIDWNGFQYGVSWHDDRAGGGSAIYFAAVSTGGVKNGADLKLSNGTGAASFTTALWNGSTFAFCWRDDRNPPTGNTEIYFAYVGCP